MLGGAALVDSFDEMVRLRRAAEAAYLRLLAAVDERKVATDVGAKSTAQWLRLRHRQAGSGRDVAAARAIAPGGELRELGQALAAGRVSREHLDVAVRALGRIPAHLKDKQRGKVAAFLTEQSTQFTPRDFEDVAHALLAVLDPDGAHSFDPDAHQRRSLSMGTDATGMTAGRFLLDQLGSAWFTTALQHYAQPDPAGCGVDEHGHSAQRTQQDHFVPHELIPVAFGDHVVGLDVHDRAVSEGDPEQHGVDALSQHWPDPAPTVAPTVERRAHHAGATKGSEQTSAPGC